MSLHIGVDFDHTYLADPETFEKLVDLFHESGHKCVLVTKRRDEGDWGKEVKKMVGHKMPIVFAGPDYKKDVAEEEGFHIDIWIDDSPEFINSPSKIKDMLDNEKWQRAMKEKKIKELESKVEDLEQQLHSTIEELHEAFNDFMDD